MTSTNIHEWDFLDNYADSYIAKPTKVTRTYKLYKPESDEEKDLVWKAKEVFLGGLEQDLADEINLNADLRMSRMWIDSKKHALFKEDNGVVKVVFKY